MRSQEDRDAKPLDVMSAVLGATFVWGAPAALVVWIGQGTDVDVSASPVLVVLWFLGYVATVVVLVKRRKEE